MPLNHRITTKKIYVGNIPIGGGSPVSVQSMTNTKTTDVEQTVKQILELENTGCEIIRVAVPDMAAAEAISDIKRNIHIPLVADIHFDYRLALKSIENGVDKLRLNPGNIGDIEKVKLVAKAAKAKNIPIRIGVNAGSLEKRLLHHDRNISPEDLVESALNHVKILEDLGFEDILISMKSSNVPITLSAYNLLTEKTSYPLHVGITEPGTLFSGGIKSAVGIGAILANGIGDTIRVSLTGSPIDEVRYGKEILKALQLRKFGVEIISCPTCGRTSIDLITLAQKVEKATENIKSEMKISLLGCVVNGPGEAKESDIGVTGGDGVGIIYRHGKIIKKVPESQLFAAVMEEIIRYDKELNSRCI